MRTRLHSHGFAGQRVDDLRAQRGAGLIESWAMGQGSEGFSYLLGIEVLLTVRLLLEQLAATMTKELVVRNLELEGTGVPGVEEVDIVGVYESELLICRNE